MPATHISSAVIPSFLWELTPFLFKVTEWFLDDLPPFFRKSLKNFLSRAVGTKGSWGGGEIAHLPQILALIEAKLSPLKGLILLLNPLDFQTFLWPCSPVKSQTALSVFSESKPANLMNFTIFYGGCSKVEASFKSLLSIQTFFSDKYWR